MAEDKGDETVGDEESEKRVNFEKLDALVVDGFLATSINGDLVLYNYTEKCTYERHWTPETINSRGHVYNRNTGECVARPFPKFFNLDEHETTRRENLLGGFTAFEKLDGSLGILYRHGGEFRVTTRGSLFSTQGARATQMLKKYDLSRIPDSITLLFEIIYPENRIVVPYGAREELVLLGAFNRHTGEEFLWPSMMAISQDTGMPLARVFPDSLDELLAKRLTMPYTDEGWVLRYIDGTRVKVKGEDYLRLAKIIMTMGPISVWEAMAADKWLEYVTQIPEEMRADVEAIHAVLHGQWSDLVADAQVLIKQLGVTGIDIQDKEAIKAMALLIQREAPEHLRGYLFQSMRGKSDSLKLLDHIRPDGNVIRVAK